jgi:undecaprenyl-diphosphatase
MDVLIEFLKYIFLGAIQGVTEVLPISSSGHVSVFQELVPTDIDNSPFFLILLNFGSMIAVIYYLRKELKIYLSDFFSYMFKGNRDKEVKKNFCYLRNVFIGIIPILVLGYFFDLLIRNYFLLNPLLIIGIGSLITATILYVVRNHTEMHVNTDVKASDAIYIGIVQVISVMPGLSRLGVATAAGVNRKLSMDSALKFTFMMLIPISIATMFYQIIQVNFNMENIMHNFDASNVLNYFYYLIAFIVSIVATYFALKWIFIWFRKGKLAFFYIYNLIFGFTTLFMGLSI